MPRNKSEEVERLRREVEILEAKLRHPTRSALLAQGNAFAMIELVEEARKEAEAWRIDCAGAMGAADVEDFARNNPFPWETILTEEEPEGEEDEEE